MPCLRSEEEEKKKGLVRGRRVFRVWCSPTAIGFALLGHRQMNFWKKRENVGLA